MTQYTLKQASQLLQSKQISSVELATEYLAAIATQNPAINGYITLDQDKTLAEARAADARIAQGNATALTGVPIAYKDIFCQTDWRSACSSKMLDNFISPYTATVVQNLLDEGMVTLGRTNMDEFAMGSTNETSFYGATKNPWNPEHVPGGSSGGSAAVVAARLAPVALGSDTGGSIRQPPSHCGIPRTQPPRLLPRPAHRQGLRHALKAGRFLFLGQCRFKGHKKRGHRAPGTYRRHRQVRDHGLVDRRKRRPRNLRVAAPNAGGEEL